MEPEKELLDLMKTWGINHELPLETVRDLQTVFAVFDRADIPEYLEISKEQENSMFEYVQQRQQVVGCDLDKLAEVVSIDPRVIINWTRHQLFLFASSELSESSRKLFPSDQSIIELKRICYEWAQKKYDESIML